MARNLQSKLSPTDTIRLYDINPSAAEHLANEMTTNHAGGAKPSIATSAAEAAHDAVSRPSLPQGPILTPPPRRPRSSPASPSPPTS